MNQNCKRKLWKDTTDDYFTKVIVDALTQTFHVTWSFLDWLIIVVKRWTRLQKNFFSFLFHRQDCCCHPVRVRARFNRFSARAHAIPHTKTTERCLAGTRLQEEEEGQKWREKVERFPKMFLGRIFGRTRATTVFLGTRKMEKNVCIICEK